MPIVQIRNFLSYRQCEILYIHTCISLKLDHCKVFLSDLKKSQIKRLKHAQNSAAHLLTATSRYEQVTPVLRCLHWLPLSSYIDFNILLLVFKVLKWSRSCSDNFLTYYLYFNRLKELTKLYNNLNETKQN